MHLHVEDQMAICVALEVLCPYANSAAHHIILPGTGWSASYAPSLPIKLQAFWKQPFNQFEHSRKGIAFM